MTRSIAVLARIVLALGLGAGAELAQGYTAAAAAQGCDKAGVAGPWIGRGSLRLDQLPFHVAFTFDDQFGVTPEALSGEMRFTSLSSVGIPAFIGAALSERYVVAFEADDGIAFRSNWGVGDGFWRREAYQMTFRSLVGGFRVVEHGSIEDCDHLVVNGEFYDGDLLVARMAADYRRPRR
jgi:hypothetical protein